MGMVKLRANTKVKVSGKFWWIEKVVRIFYIRITNTVLMDYTGIIYVSVFIWTMDEAGSKLLGEKIKGSWQ